jgi:hypothetical protein
VPKRPPKATKPKKKTSSVRPRDDGRRGVRTTEAEHHVRLRILEEMMASCVPWHAIVADLTVRFDVSAPTVHTWSLEIRNRWAKEEEELRPQRKSMYRARLDALYARAWREGDLLIATQVAKLQGQLDGLLSQTTRLQVSGQVDVAALTPDQRRREIEALLERRRLAAPRPAMIEAQASEKGAST